MKNTRKPITYCNSFKELFYLFYVYVHVSMYLHMSAESEEARRGHWSPSELELQVGVNCQVLENRTRILCKGNKCCYPPHYFLLYKCKRWKYSSNTCFTHRHVH